MVQAGLSYEFTVNLEFPGDGYAIEPIASVNGINFVPSIIEFEDFK